MADHLKIGWLKSLREQPDSNSGPNAGAIKNHSLMIYNYIPCCVKGDILSRSVKNPWFLNLNFVSSCFLWNKPNSNVLMDWTSPIYLLELRCASCTKNPDFHKKKRVPLARNTTRKPGLFISFLRPHKTHPWSKMPGSTKSWSTQQI